MTGRLAPIRVGRTGIPRRAGRATFTCFAVLTFLWLAPGASASVLVVGDSLAMGTEGALRAAIPEMTIDADSEGGRTSSTGVGVLRDSLRPQHDTVVFDLGTNDGPTGVALTASSLAAARTLAAGRCLVVATLNHPPVAGIPIEAQNSMIRRFVGTTPNAVLVEWHDVAAVTPRALQRDGVHATPSGYVLRATLFAEAIRSCLTGGDGGSSSGPPPLSGRRASATTKPADRRRNDPSRDSPGLAGDGGQLADAAFDRIASGGTALSLAGKAAEAVLELATSASSALTQSGPEPILGAPY